MERKKNLLNKIFTPKLLIIEWSFIVLFCIFIFFSNTVHAASDNKLPYIVEENLIEDWSFYRSNFEELANAWGYPQSYIEDLNWESDQIIVRSIINDGRVAYTYVFVPRFSATPSYSISLSQSYDNFDYSVDYVTIRFTGYEVLQYNTNSSLVTNFYGYATSGMSTVSFLGSYPFPVFISGDFTDSNQNIIFKLPSSGDIDVSGHATPPINNTGHYIPNPHPNKPTPTTYTPPTPQFPSIDTSTLENLVESLIDVVEYGFTYTGTVISGWFSNLVSNVSDYLEYISDLLVYGFNNVVGAIQDFATDFYNNMVSLFEPLLNGLAEFGQAIEQTIENISLFLEAFFAPFDEEQFQEAYNNCQFISAVDGFKDSIEEFEHAFEYAEERDYFTLYLGFIMDGYTVNYDLDFTWLYPLRQYYRPIIWCVVVYEFFVYLCAQLSDYLQGRSGK